MRHGVHRSYQRVLLKAFRARSIGARIAALTGIRPSHFKPQTPDAGEPRTGLSMGESCELMAKRWQISRDEQDQLACDSHQRASEAWQSGFFDDLVQPFAGLERDDNLRSDTTLQKLAALRPSFDKRAGTLTAGNSTPLTDGASTVLLASEQWAREQGLPVLAWLSFGKAWAVDFAATDSAQR